VNNSDLREALLGAQPNSANAGQHSVQEQAQAEDEPAARFWQTYTRKREQARRKLKQVHVYKTAYASMYKYLLDRLPALTHSSLGFEPLSVVVRR
jgi:hypothetical protein